MQIAEYAESISPTGTYVGQFSPNSSIICVRVTNNQCSRLYSEDELPAEFKLYLPVQQKQQAQQQMSQQMLQQQQQQLQNEQMMAAAGTSGSGGGGENDI